MFRFDLSCTACNSIESLLASETRPPASVSCASCGHVLFSATPLGGIVYVLSNPAIPGRAKIGQTSRPIEERIAELSSSPAVPEPFVLEAAFGSDDPLADEALAHHALDDYRSSPQREFFFLGPTEAVDQLAQVLKVGPLYRRSAASTESSIELPLDPAPEPASDLDHYCRHCGGILPPTCREPLGFRCPKCRGMNYRDD